MNLKKYQRVFLAFIVLPLLSIQGVSSLPFQLHGSQRTQGIQRAFSSIVSRAGTSLYNFDPLVESEIFQKASRVQKDKILLDAFLDRKSQVFKEFLSSYLTQSLLPLFVMCFGGFVLLILLNLSISRIQGSIGETVQFLNRHLFKNSDPKDISVMLKCAFIAIIMDLWAIVDYYLIEPSTFEENEEKIAEKEEGDVFLRSSSSLYLMGHTFICAAIVLGLMSYFDSILPVLLTPWGPFLLWLFRVFKTFPTRVLLSLELAFSERPLVKDAMEEVEYLYLVKLKYGELNRTDDLLKEIESLMVKNRQHKLSEEEFHDQVKVIVYFYGAMTPPRMDQINRKELYDKIQDLTKYQSEEFRNSLQEVIMLRAQGVATVPVLAEGEPGTGKTYVANGTSKVLGGQCAEVPLENVREVREIIGSTSKGGLFMRTMAERYMSNPELPVTVLLCDEFEKCINNFPSMGIMMLKVFDTHLENEIFFPRLGVSIKMPLVIFITNGKINGATAQPLYDRFRKINVEVGNPALFAFEVLLPELEKAFQMKLDEDEIDEFLELFTPEDDEDDEDDENKRKLKSFRRMRQSGQKKFVEIKQARQKKKALIDFE